MAAHLLARIRPLARDPLVVFLLIGGAFFLAFYLLQRDETHRIELTRGMRAELADEFEAIAGHKPDAADQAKLDKDYVTDELLFREAVARGMHLTDKQTKQRLIDKLRFLITGAPAEPTEEQLIDFYTTHLDLYKGEAKISFEQVFFQQPPPDPAAVLAALRAGRTVAGDDYWVGNRFPDYGVAMLRGIFNPSFVERLEAAPHDVWSGPYTTPRGTHFVRKAATAAPAMLPYAQIREQVRRDYLGAQDSAAIDREVARLEKTYDVAIDR